MIGSTRSGNALTTRWWIPSVHLNSEKWPCTTRIALYYYNNIRSGSSVQSLCMYGCSCTDPCPRFSPPPLFLLVQHDLKLICPKYGYTCKLCTALPDHPLSNGSVKKVKKNKSNPNRADVLINNTTFRMNGVYILCFYATQQ